VIYGYFVLAIGAGLALASWNAHRTGELQGPWFDLVERQQSRDAFQFYLVIRFVCAGLFMLLGTLAALLLRP
jgi:hypothetical protein